MIFKGKIGKIQKVEDILYRPIHTILKVDTVDDRHLQQGLH